MDQPHLAYHARPIRQERNYGGFLTGTKLDAVAGTNSYGRARFVEVSGAKVGL